MFTTLLAAPLLCASPVVIDGDSLLCRNIGDVRLIAIDTPDSTHSRPCLGEYGDHVCDDRASRRATQAMRVLVRGAETVRIIPVTRDRYGRTVARVEADGKDLSCAMLANGHSRYIARYDNGGRIRARCPSVAR